MSDLAKIVCGKCKADPQIRKNANGETEAVCPRCGQRDNVKDAMRIAGEHFEHEAGAALQDIMRGAVKGNEFMKFEASPLPQQSFRWHAV